VSGATNHFLIKGKRSEKRTRSRGCGGTGFGGGGERISSEDVPRASGFLDADEQRSDTPIEGVDVEWSRKKGAYFEPIGSPSKPHAAWWGRVQNQKEWRRIKEKLGGDYFWGETITNAHLRGRDWRGRGCHSKAISKHLKTPFLSQLRRYGTY